MKRSTLTRLVIGAAGSAALLLAACTNDRANVSDPLSTVAYGFGLLRDGRGIPSGSVVTRRNFSARNATRVDSSITLTVAGLDTLSQGDYVVWLGTVDDATVRRVIEHFDRLDLRATVERRVAERYRLALHYLDAAGPREPWRGYLAAVCEALVSRRA